MDDKKQTSIIYANRARKMWVAVVLAVIDDAIKENRETGKGTEKITRWAKSRDGRDVLSNAGLDPTDDVVIGIGAFVDKGIRVSTSLKQNSAKS